MKLEEWNILTFHSFPQTVASTASKTRENILFCFLSPLAEVSFKNLLQIRIRLFILSSNVAEERNDNRKIFLCGRIQAVVKIKFLN